MRIGDVSSLQRIQIGGMIAARQKQKMPPYQMRCRSHCPVLKLCTAVDLISGNSPAGRWTQQQRFDRDLATDKTTCSKQSPSGRNLPNLHQHSQAASAKTTAFFNLEPGSDRFNGQSFYNWTRPNQHFSIARSASSRYHAPNPPGRTDELANSDISLSTAATALCGWKEAGC